MAWGELVRWPHWTNGLWTATANHCHCQVGSQLPSSGTSFEDPRSVRSFVTVGHGLLHGDSSCVSAVRTLNADNRSGIDVGSRASRIDRFGGVKFVIFHHAIRQGGTPWFVLPKPTRHQPCDRPDIDL
ncbi:citrate (Si)-synthase [Anopheles sinensis]|uniref:Citrate (Si)-synthase n=1 Tax=Anopheles sinensis TaxID=74873 RepID=A0A084VC38_ANOSI|nr:citrate (Si)-synthase [Anopheles sinensis]